MNYGMQVAVITYDKHGANGAFAKWHIENEKRNGRVVVLRDGHATVHLAK